MKTHFIRFIILITFYSCTNYSQRKDNAEHFFLEKKYDRALIEINKAIELNPDSISYYELRETIYGLMGYYEEAISDIDKMIELNNNANYEHLYMLERGTIKLKMGLYKEALLDLDYFIDNIDTTDDFNKIMLKDCYISKGTLCYLLNDYKNANKYYSLVLEEDNRIFKVLDVKALVGLSNLTSSSNESLDLLNRALNIDTCNDLSYAARAALYVELENIEMAYYDLKMAISINPYDALSHMNMGTLFMNYLNNDDSAIMYYERAIELAPQSPQIDMIYLNLGSIKNRLGYIDEALEDFNSGENINPENDLILFNIAVLLTDKSHYKEALKKINMAIQINRSDPEYYNLKGCILFSISSFRDAEIAYLVAVKINPEYGDANFNLGYLYSEQKNYEQSIDYYEKAININYDLEITLVNCALQKIEINRVSSACIDLKRAYQIGRVDIKQLMDKYCN